MKNLALITILLFALSISSCKKDPFEAYEGTWSGTYTGQDGGVWNATIDIEGKVTGTAASNLALTNTFPLTGTVTEEGVFTATVTYDLGISSITYDYTGQITENNISGTWIGSMLSLAGDWTGTKDE